MYASLLGKSSRMTGLHLYTADLYKQDTTSGEHWECRRKRIFKTALEQWKSSSYEMRRLRQSYSNRAKELNKTNNMQRDLHLMDAEVKQAIQNDHMRTVTHHQRQVVQTAIEDTLICPVGLDAPIPSNYRPLALTEYAQHHTTLPITDGDKTAIVQSTSTPDEIDSFKVVGHKVAESALVLTDHGHGLHGLGDTEFGVSRAIIDELSTQSGFVEASNRQFRNSHSQVCDTEISFASVGSTDDIRERKSCQELCGRFCKHDINDANRTLFYNTVEMIRSIARIVGGRRDIKHGHTLFMSPTVLLPLLVISTTNGLFARLSSRFSFSPLEVDWLHCSVEAGGCSDDVLYTVTLIFTVLDGGSNYLCPPSDNMCELAMWLSATFVVEQGHKCELFLEYELDETRDDVLLVRKHHRSSTTLNPDGDSFQSLLVPKQRKRPVPDEDETLTSVGNMLSVISADTKNRKQRSKQDRGKTTSNARQLLAGKQRGSQAAKKKHITSCNHPFLKYQSVRIPYGSSIIYHLSLRKLNMKYIFQTSSYKSYIISFFLSQIIIL